MFSVLQGARRDSCDDDDCDGGDCDRIIIIDSQWFIIVMILNTVAIAMMAVRWPVMTFHLLIIRGHYMRPAAIRGGGNCQGRMPRGETIFSRIKARIGAGKDIHNKDAAHMQDGHARRFTRHCGSRGRHQVVRASEVVSHVSCMSARAHIRRVDRDDANRAAWLHMCVLTLLK